MTDVQITDALVARKKCANQAWRFFRTYDLLLTKSYALKTKNAEERKFLLPYAKRWTELAAEIAHSRFGEQRRASSGYAQRTLVNARKCEVRNAAPSAVALMTLLERRARERSISLGPARPPPSSHESPSNRADPPPLVFGEPVIILKVHLNRGEIHHRATAFDSNCSEVPSSGAMPSTSNSDATCGRACLGTPRRVLLEADGNFSVSLRQMFARAQIEWHAGPTPVVDLDLQRDIRLDIGAWRNVGFLAIGFCLLAQYRAGAVLAPYRRHVFVAVLCCDF